MSINIPGYAVQNAGAISVQKTFHDFGFPNLTSSSVVLRSGAGMQIAPSSQAGRWFVSPQAPVIGLSAGFFQPGDFVIVLGQDGTGRTLFQRESSAWTNVGEYTSQAEPLATAYTLDGGDSDDIDTAIVQAGNGNQLVLTGAFDLSRPISLDQVSFRGQLEIVFDNATITWNGDSLPPAADLNVTATSYQAASYGSKELLPAWTEGPVKYHAVTGRQIFVRDLLLNASFR